LPSPSCFLSWLTLAMQDHEHRVEHLTALPDASDVCFLLTRRLFEYSLQGRDEFVELHARPCNGCIARIVLHQIVVVIRLGAVTAEGGDEKVAVFLKEEKFLPILPVSPHLEELHAPDAAGIEIADVTVATTLICTAVEAVAMQDGKRNADVLQDRTKFRHDPEDDLAGLLRLPAFVRIVAHEEIVRIEVDCRNIVRGAVGRTHCQPSLCLAPSEIGGAASQVSATAKRELVITSLFAAAEYSLFKVLIY